jgi:hypothetical protein
MRNDKIISIVTHAYRVFCPSDLLRIKPFRRAYVFTDSSKILFGSWPSAILNCSMAATYSISART